MANSGINSPLEFNSYNVSPRELINWIDLRVLALAGSKDSILPELATIIFFDIFLEPQDCCNSEINIIDIDKKLLFTTLTDDQPYKPPVDEALNLVLDDDRPLKIINAPENISAAIMRLQNFEDRFLYVIKYLDKDISRYLTESQEAINFYYTVEEKSTGIKSPLEFNSYNVSPRELINWIDLRVLALAGSKDSIFPELATIIFWDILFEPQEFCKK